MDADRLVAMANQIARNLAAQGEAAAVEQTAQHIRDFWDPRMKTAILAVGAGRMGHVAAAAVARLRADRSGDNGA